MGAGVPPRDLAATITAKAVLRTGWALAIGHLLVCAVLIIDLAVAGTLRAPLTVPLSALAVLLAGVVLLFHRPSGFRGAVFLVVGSFAAFAYDYALLSSTPELYTEGSFLLTRVSIVLMLVGPVSRRLIDGVWWCLGGYLLGAAALAAAQGLNGLYFRPGWGPTVALAIYLILIVTLAIIRRDQHKYAPDFPAIELETAKMAAHRELQERAVGLIHDTVLNDLRALATAPDTLDERARTRLLSDIAAVSGVTLPKLRLRTTAASPQGTDEPAVDAFRPRLLDLVSDFQWRGLSVELSGGEALPIALTEARADSLVSAVAACLENVLQHSGQSAAEVVVEHTDTEVTVMVVDQGRGFAPAAVPETRLGLKLAVTRRIEGCGGAVRVWSHHGQGTSIMLTVPLEVQNA